MIGKLPECWIPPAHLLDLRARVRLDITMYQSDQRRSPGRLSRQGPPTLRWALYEAAVVASRAGSPDRDYYLQAAARFAHKRACLAIARKPLKRSYHTLRELGDEALQPASASHRAPAPHVSRCTAASSRQTAAATPPAWTARKDRAAAPHFPSGNHTPSPSCRRPRSQPGIVDQDKHGRPRAQPPNDDNRRNLTRPDCTDKQPSSAALLAT